ncbi:DUF947-domain-containing protein [Aaosphaeria arxii CBS 175.79]|uniref:rRNA biogenesis protein RRP36 n=1 Tax=Aaosphaeria arxii CBS 175.79 TaxID=1450172 RepID=A0A6A5XUQ9_9PLEO|nr:DUF947-domain-containing protein [Aaosphaeria arxii CBS 175.79]KAF2016693.1 DUF947-domain-containing protein [Aaosphaeria arxii CBS 175.79]
MPLNAKLERNLRAVEDDSDENSYYEVSDRSSPSVVETGEEGANLLSSEEDEDEDEGEDEQLSDTSQDDQVQQQLSKVSFGALAKAQDALSKQQSNRKRKRGDETTGAQEDKLQALRARLQEIKAEKLAKAGKPQQSAKPSKKAKQAQESDDDVEDEDTSDSDSAPHARSSKHAPAVQSSKRAVTRRRNVVEVKKRNARDPRFDAATGPRTDENTFKKRYAFLDDYRDSEIAELRSTIKKTKSEDDKEKLKRKLLSMESQKKARAAKDKQQEITREHKKKEKELIKQGKTPFYLKKAEQKKLALIDQFQNMKSKQRDRVIERRRKKLTSRERRNMPAERRAG